MRQFKLFLSLLICGAWGLIIVPPIRIKTGFPCMKKFVILYQFQPFPSSPPPYPSKLEDEFLIRP